MFHIGWQKLDAKLIDRRFLRRDSYNVHVSGSSYQVWEYMVELPVESGPPLRLTLKEKTFKLSDPEIGDTVPILVNRKRTKAAFDLKDPRIDATASRKAKERAEKAADGERFERKLRGLD